MKKGLRLVAAAVVYAVVFSLFSACGTASEQGQSSSSLNSESSGKDIVGYPAYTGDSFSSWTPLYLTTSAMKKDSFFGGLGNSTKTGITVLKKNSETVLVATSDAGVLRSENAGSLWHNSSTGINSLGFDCIASDPNNSDFVIAISASGEKEQFNGVYFSENAGITWEQSDLNISFSPLADIQIVFDKSSYNAQTKKSSIIYIAVTDVFEDNEGVLLCSENSGKSFKNVKNIQKHTTIAVHPTKSYLYLADDSGFYRSINRGFSFEKLLEDPVDCVCVSPAAPDSIFLLCNGQVLVSKNNGQSFDDEIAFLPHGDIVAISVSPLDANLMLAHYKDDDSAVKIAYSSDAGENWHESAVYDSPYKMSARSERVMFAWSPSDPSVVYALFDNTIYKSSDAGALFSWSGNGDSGFSMNGRVSQNVRFPEYMGLAISRDTIAYTNDGGLIWTVKTYDNYKQRFNIKAVYPVDRSKLIAIMENVQNGSYEIRFSDNGGEYFNPTDVQCAPFPFFYSDPSDKNIVFAADMRSTDGGVSWRKMEDCDYVLTHNPVSPNELFGVKGNSVVVSYNKGKKWERLVNIQCSATDLAFDYNQRAIYAATGSSLLKYYFDEQRLEVCTDSVLSNQFGETVITSVSVDPLYPNVVYAGGMGSGYINNSSIIISENSGQNWYIISASTTNDSLYSNYPGGLQPVDMVLSPERELIVFSAKFGISKLGKYTVE